MQNWDEHLENAPITKAALWTSPEDKAPPPIEQEWKALVNHDRDVVLFWGGAWNRRGKRFGWTTWSERTSAPGDDDGPRQPNRATGTPAASVERMLSPLAHEARVRIMQALYLGPKSSGELSQATGLKGGNLYYHLKELIHAAYVTENDFGYDLTPLGCQILITVTEIAAQMVADRGEQGLMVTSAGWE